MVGSRPDWAAAVLIGTCALMTGCGGGSSSGSSDAVSPPPASAAPPATGGTPSSDERAPTVSTRAPDAQAVDVSVTTKVVVSFDESLDAASIDDQSLMLTEQAVAVAGSVTYDDDARSLVFTPDVALDAETVYGVTLGTGVADSAGNAILGDDWFFTTGGPFNLGATSQITIDQCMSDNDKQMLTLVNNARAAGQTCGGDVIAAQTTLAWSCLLDDAALGHSRSMADNDFHAHTSPVDGSDAGDRIRATGYTPRSWGENIAAGYADEEAVMAGWLDSAGHCRNLMASGFSEMGAASAENAGSTYRIYWTQNFGDPQ